MQEKLALSMDISDREIAAQCKTFRDALRMAREKSGKSEKVITLELEERGHKIDQSTLSLSLSDNPSQKKNFPAEAVTDFIDITNDIPLRYLAMKRGFGLIRLKSEVELENERLRSELEEKNKELSVITNFMKSIKS
jgi:hypothetical protein